MNTIPVRLQSIRISTFPSSMPEFLAPVSRVTALKNSTALYNTSLRLRLKMKRLEASRALLQFFFVTALTANRTAR